MFGKLTTNTMEKKSNVNYYEEISSMLFGFGDAPIPNKDTVALVSSIVVQQLRTIIQEALKFSDGRNLKGEELVFLMRHNKHKMRRFVKHLANKELKKEIQKEAVQISNIDVIINKPKHPLITFIENIDETGEFTDLSEFDEVKHNRQVRASYVSETLDEEKYLKYQKARCVSFVSGRGYEKFRIWLDPRKEVNFTTTALEVLAYYAFETVAQLVDFAFLVRLDNKRGPDPLNNMKAYCIHQPITVNEIKEVMRRVSSPQVGKLNFGGKLPETHYMLAL